MAEKNWDARDFIARLRAGEFDGHISEVLGDFTAEQLQQVSRALPEEPLWDYDWIETEDLKRSG